MELKHAILQQMLDRGRLYLRTSEACRLIGVSTPTFYKMRALGVAPKEMEIPGIQGVWISIEEIDRWMTARENPTREEKLILAKQRANRKLSSGIAAAGRS